MSTQNSGAPIPGIDYTAAIVSAYVSNPQHNVPKEHLGDLLRSVHGTVAGLVSGAIEAQPQKPAVPIKKSVTNSFIVCLEDGRKMKMLKRYLRSHYNLSPGEYRAKWGLPRDYPMVAPEYAAQRSTFAKQIGLGLNSPKTKGKRP